MLAGRTWRRRAGYAAIAFGAWDIFYYVFLRLISGWPRTLLDWDILFLLPLPWWGPVLAPVSIALVMILWGTLATQSDDACDRRPLGWAFGWLGIVLALAVFMIDAWRALPDGRDAVLQVLPDDVQLAAVLGGLAADGVTGASSSCLVTHEEAEPYFFRAALISASMWSRYFSNARRPAALSRYSVRGVRPANVFSHST